MWPRHGPDKFDILAVAHSHRERRIQEEDRAVQHARGDVTPFHYIHLGKSLGSAVQSLLVDILDYLNAEIKIGGCHHLVHDLLKPRRNITWLMLLLARSIDELKLNHHGP